MNPTMESREDTARPGPSPVLGACLLALCGSSCASTDSGAKNDFKDTVPYIRPAAQLDEPIGKFLADLDWQINAWCQLVLTADGDKDRHKASLLEQNLSYVTSRRVHELIQQLEAGPLNNRVVAAAALGFSQAVEAQSPLLSALEERDTRVVGNALLGLAILENPDTPLERIAELLETSTDAGVRRMAAYAARQVAGKATLDEGMLDAARRGLLDEEPGVRAQCALLLAQATDTESIDFIADMLYDEVPLVSSAAAWSLAEIGRDSTHHKGQTGRALAGSLERLNNRKSARVIAALVYLSGQNHGREPEAWKEWAHRLP